MNNLMTKFSNRKTQLYGEKEEGKKVFGLFCSFVPVELVLASNSIPVGLCGGKNDTIAVAEEDLPRNICPLIKSSYGFKKQNHALILKRLMWLLEKPPAMQKRKCLNCWKILFVFMLCSSPILKMKNH